MGLDLGLEAAGFSVRLASEIDEDAAATVRKNRPDIPLIGDIHQYAAVQVRAAAGVGDADIDVVVGGPCCQSFSTAGKRKALDDVRGIAVLKFASLALELRPSTSSSRTSAGCCPRKEATCWRRSWRCWPAAATP